MHATGGRQDTVGGSMAHATGGLLLAACSLRTRRIHRAARCGTRLRVRRGVSGMKAACCCIRSSCKRLDRSRCSSPWSWQRPPRHFLMAAPFLQGYLSNRFGIGCVSPQKSASQIWGRHLLETEGYAPLRKVVRGKLASYFISRQDFDVILSDSS